ncbi:SURF1 family cytochrome oxidase biogenesis protein [Leucobacter sp. HY1908]
MSGSKRPEYLGEPTLARVMRRPRWILALLLALAVAAGFAALAQWQAGFAVQSKVQEEIDTETPRALSDVASPTQGVTEEAAASVVLAGGAFAPGDFTVVTKRVNDGAEGAWVVGNLVTTGVDAAPGAHLAVAVGWAPTEAAAEAAAAALSRDPDLIDARQLEGRYMPPEAPQIPRAASDPQSLAAMTSAHLANVWQHVDGPVYAGYFVLHPAAGSAGDASTAALTTLGLDPIDSVAPLPVDAVNWLNVFYAIEWLVFAGFAVFFWYRLARDAWEKEHELKILQAAGEQEPAAPLETER